MVTLNQLRSIIVPTDDNIVRKQLRDLDEPMCFFGEGPAERRERLAKALANLTPEVRQKLQANDIKPIEDKDQDQTFFYEGGEALKKARYFILDYSLRQCNDRLDMSRIELSESLSTRLIPQQDLLEKVREIEDLGSYVDDDTSTTDLKTLTSCNMNPSGTILSTSCRSGKCKLWSLPDMETQLTLKGHQAMANFIVFSPKSGTELEPSVANLSSCAMNGTVLLWNLIDESPIFELSGPQSWSVTRNRFHPSGKYLATCCSDKSWRLWDLESTTEILHQEGHSDSVFDIGFHPDGSLAGSAGMDTYTRLWDLRSGKSIELLEGHTKGIRSIDFSPDGYHVATGGIDNTVKIWNLRQRKLEYTIPAHLGAVTTVMFEKKNGFYLTTSSVDKTVKFWSSQTWAPIKTLDAYDERVANFDITMNGDYVATCYSRYIKLWNIKLGN